MCANAFPLPRETMFPAPLCGSLLLKTTVTTYETGVDHLACPHLSISIVKRSAGQSAVASAAYQSGSALYSEHDRKRKSYSEKQGIVYTEIMLCANAPPEYSDRNTLWNAVEKAETQWNAQLARKVILALPIEVPKSEYPQMLRDYCTEHFVSRGMCADFAIHIKDDHNPHAHIMLTMRSIGEDGSFLPKSRKEYILDENGERIRLPSGEWKTKKVNTNDWNEQTNAEIWRQGWAEIQNRYLEKANATTRVDLRSYERQGIDQIPGVHLGPAAFQLEKRGVPTMLGDLNIEINYFNNLLRRIKRAIQKLHEWIDGLKDNYRKAMEENAERERIEREHDLYGKLRRYMEVRASERQDWSTHAQLQGRVNDLEDVQTVMRFMEERHIRTVEDLEHQLTVSELMFSQLRSERSDNAKEITRRGKLRDAHTKALKLYKDVMEEYNKRHFQLARDMYYNKHKPEIDEFRRLYKYLKDNGAPINKKGNLDFDKKGNNAELEKLTKRNEECDKLLAGLEYSLKMMRKIEWYVRKSEEELKPVQRVSVREKLNENKQKVEQVQHKKRRREEVL